MTTNHPTPTEIFTSYATWIDQTEAGDNTAMSLYDQASDLNEQMRGTIPARDRMAFKEVGEAYKRWFTRTWC